MTKIRNSMISFFVLAMIFLHGSALAATFNGSTTQQFRQALLAAATNGQTDTIILAGGTYKTTDDGGGTFTFFDNENYDLTIQGSSPENVVLSGDRANQVLNSNVINFTPTIHLVKISVRNGNSGASGGGILSEEKIQIENCIISDNAANGGGGGFYFSGTSSITDSTISGNTAGTGGGFYSGGVMSAINSIISGNTAGTEIEYCRLMSE